MAEKHLSYAKALGMLHEPRSYLFASMPGGKAWTVVRDNGRKHGGWLSHGDAMRLLSHPNIRPQQDGMFGTSQTFILRTTSTST
ncbi:hypothetical protein [Bradyrhizobium sp. SZCCHNR3003]|uniref:hypothetical protein n=1 Tax=Bradyrhizobium sp. SZCCHNR3003 TaxID=3057387 RepID=UPI0029161323|nr:hypothetical protein [Bradyrhizobium sp. SZCCHNR3003]